MNCCLRTVRNFFWNYFGNNYCADILLLYCSVLLLFNRSESLLEFRNISEYSDVLFQYNRMSRYSNFRFTRSKELLFF